MARGMLRLDVQIAWQVAAIRFLSMFCLVAQLHRLLFLGHWTSYIIVLEPRNLLYGLLGLCQESNPITVCLPGSLLKSKHGWSSSRAFHNNQLARFIHTAETLATTQQHVVKSEKFLKAGENFRESMRTFKVVQIS